MVRNGLYAVSTKMLDGIDGGGGSVMVLRDGALRGGNSFNYYIGSYSCSGPHTQPLELRLFSRTIVTVGFSGTYTDDGAEFEATALVGKRSLRLKSTFRLIQAD